MRTRVKLVKVTIPPNLVPITRLIASPPCPLHPHLGALGRMPTRPSSASFIAFSISDIHIIPKCPSLKPESLPI